MTTKTADHNMCRDILSAMGSAFGFVTSKEVVVAPWFKKPDVELFRKREEQRKNMLSFGEHVSEFPSSRNQMLNVSVQETRC